MTATTVAASDVHALLERRQQYSRDHLEEWMRPEERSVFSPYDRLGATAQGFTGRHEGRNLRGIVVF